MNYLFNFSTQQELPYKPYEITNNTLTFNCEPIKNIV